MGTIPEYPAPARALDGSEPIAAWQDGQQRALTLGALASYVLSLGGAGGAADYNALAALIDTGDELTRDPYMAAEVRHAEGLLGGTTYTNGVPTTKQALIVDAFFGNSLAVGQGVGSVDATPLEQVKPIYGALLPEAKVYCDMYGVPGSWQTQMGEQIDAMLATHFAALNGGDGRSRIPTSAHIFTGTNDARATIFHSLEGPKVFRSTLTYNIKRLQKLGSTVYVYTAPEMHGPRSLAGGVHDMAEPFFPSYPSNGFVAGDDKFQQLTYSVADQTITSSTPGQFKPQLYDNGWLSFDGKSWIYVPEQSKFMRIIGADPSFTTLKVDDGNGGPVITENRQTLKGLYQAKINDQTQLIPAKNKPDLTRPTGAQAGVPLALERRPIGPNGESILISIRLAILNRIIREVAAQTGAILVPWNEAFRLLLTSDDVLDELYPGGEYLHPNNDGYFLITPLLRSLIGRAVSGHSFS